MNHYLLPRSSDAYTACVMPHLDNSNSYIWGLSCYFPGAACSLCAAWLPVQLPEPKSQCEFSAERGSLPCNEVEDPVLSLTWRCHTTYEEAGLFVFPVAFLSPQVRKCRWLCQSKLQNRDWYSPVISQSYCLALLILSECLCLSVPQYGSDFSLMLHGLLIYSGAGGYKKAGTRASSYYRTPVCPCLPKNILFTDTSGCHQDRLNYSRCLGNSGTFLGIGAYVIGKHLLCLKPAPAYTWKDWWRQNEPQGKKHSHRG